MKENNRNKNTLKNQIELNRVTESLKLNLAKARRKHSSTMEQKYLYFIFETCVENDNYKITLDSNKIIEQIWKEDKESDVELKTEFLDFVNLRNSLYINNEYSKKIQDMLLLESEIKLMIYQNNKIKVLNRKNKDNRIDIDTKDDIKKKFIELNESKKKQFCDQNKISSTAFNIESRINNYSNKTGVYFVKSFSDKIISRINFCDDSVFDVEWFKDKFVINDIEIKYSDIVCSETTSSKYEEHLITSNNDLPAKPVTYLKTIDSEFGCTYLRNKTSERKCISWFKNNMIVHLKSGDIVMNYEDLK
jgi:hypothetical protein